MKKITTTLITIFAIMATCHAQLLQNKFAKIDLTDGITKRGTLTSYATNALIIIRAAKDSSNGKFDRITFNSIEKIKLLKINHSTQFTTSLGLTGLLIGSMKGKQYDAPPDPDALVDFSGLITAVSGRFGCFIGVGIGGLADLIRVNKQYYIGRDKYKFEDFITQFKISKKL